LFDDAGDGLIHDGDLAGVGLFGQGVRQGPAEVRTFGGVDECLSDALGSSKRHCTVAAEPVGQLLERSWCRDAGGGQSVDAAQVFGEFGA
jgi:hypothetical protein